MAGDTTSKNHRPLQKDITKNTELVFNLWTRVNPADIPQPVFHVYILTLHTQRNLTTVFFGSFAPSPQNAMLAKLIRQAVSKKIVSATLPINIAFWGEGGKGLQQKTVVKFRCELRVIRFRGALTLYTVFVMFTPPQLSDCDLAKDQRA